MAKISKRLDYGRTRTATSINEKKKRKSPWWTRLGKIQTTKPIAYNFGMLFNDGEKIA